MGQDECAPDDLSLERQLWRCHGLPTRPEIDQEKCGTAPAAFDVDVRMALALTEEFARAPRSFTFGSHPMFGNMTEDEWMRWGYLHTDHHLRQFAR